MAASWMHLEPVVLLTRLSMPVSANQCHGNATPSSLDFPFDRIGATDVEHRVCFGDGCLDTISLSKVGRTLA